MMEVTEAESSPTKYGDWPIVGSEMPGLMASLWEYRAHQPPIIGYLKRGASHRDF